MTTALPQTPGWLKLIDSAIRKVGGGRVSLDADRLLAACGGTFDDRSFEPSLRSFCAAFEGYRSLTFIGRRALKWMIVSALQRRQRVERDVRAHPEIRDIAITRPIFVLGPPRTGTTLLQQLLALDPECRWLRPWEIEQPYPEKAAWGGVSDKRLAGHEKQLARIKKSGTALDAIHPADSPAECWQLLWDSFASHTIFLFFGLGEAYEKWRETLTQERAVAAYRFYRLQLQHFLWLRPGRYWVLKAPEHTVHLRALLEVFPDAVAVQLNRDAAEYTPSLCSLAWHCEYNTVSGCNAATLGRQVVATMSEWARKNRADRALLPAGCVMDVDYRELVARPEETVRRIHERAGIAPAIEGAMDAWLAEKHRSRKAAHHYSAEQFGLAGAAL